MPLGRSQCLIHCRIEALVYFSFWFQGDRNRLPILLRPFQECVRKVDFVDLTKDHEFLFKMICTKSMLPQTFSVQCRIWDV